MRENNLIQEDSTDSIALNDSLVLEAKEAAV